jgi:hypothetical protein
VPFASQVLYVSQFVAPFPASSVRHRFVDGLLHVVMASNGSIYVSSFFSDGRSRRAFVFWFAPRPSVLRRTYPNRAGLPGGPSFFFHLQCQTFPSEFIDHRKPLQPLALRSLVHREIPAPHAIFVLRLFHCATVPAVASCKFLPLPPGRVPQPLPRLSRLRDCTAGLSQNR